MKQLKRQSGQQDGLYIYLPENQMQMQSVLLVLVIAAKGTHKNMADREKQTVKTASHKRQTAALRTNKLNINKRNN